MLVLYERQKKIITIAACQRERRTLMDYEKLIEQLKQKDGLWCSVPTGEKLVTDAADASPPCWPKTRGCGPSWSRNQN